MEIGVIGAIGVTGLELSLLAVVSLVGEEQKAGKDFVPIQFRSMEEAIVKENRPKQLSAIHSVAQVTKSMYLQKYVNKK